MQHLEQVPLELHEDVRAQVDLNGRDDAPARQLQWNPGYRASGRHQLERAISIPTR